MFGTSASTEMRILHPLIFYPTWDFNPDHVRDTVTTTVYIVGFHVKDFFRVSESHKHCRGKLNPQQRILPKRDQPLPSPPGRICHHVSFKMYHTGRALQKVNFNLGHYCSHASVNVQDHYKHMA